MPCSLFSLMSRRNGTCENSRVGEMGEGEIGVGKMGQIIGETGIIRIVEMGVGKTGTHYGNFSVLTRYFP